MPASADMMRRQGWSIAVPDEQLLMTCHTDSTGLLEKRSHAIIGRARRDSINRLQVQEMSCAYIWVGSPSGVQLLYKHSLLCGDALHCTCEDSLLLRLLQLTSVISSPCCKPSCCIASARRPLLDATTPPWQIIS